MNKCSYIHERGLGTYRRKMKIEKVNEFLFFNKKRPVAPRIQQNT